MTSDLLTVKEAAEVLHTSESGLRWILNQGRIKSARLGGRRMLRRSDIEAYIAAAFDDEPTESAIA